MQTSALTVWSVAILTGAATTLIGAALLLRRQEKNAADLARRRAMQDHDVAGDDSGRPRLLFTLQRAGEMVSKGKASLSLRERLAAAGYHGQSAAAVYLGAKVLLFGAGVLVISLLLLPFHADLGMPSVYMLTAITGGVCFFIPDLAVGIARDRRRQNIRRHLPDAVDLLEICVSAGLGLDQAWNSVAEELRRVSPVLADEMELTNLEISLGASRAVAMRHMAERTGAEDISSLVALLVQSERFGASIVDALRTFATTMRETWSQRAEESAERMAVKMLFPMVLFIFPALVIIMVGPAVLGFIQAMGPH
ncbi:MAG TPA: type II secretion system F family protein [Planctomycetota bacterium]|jgi:tight adherence protein C|nr:type II secretion system F family protein [Planctomycetota bacterium]